MNRALIVGVMGGANASPHVAQEAYALGALIAQQGWVLLNGGRNAGVMAASAKGAAAHGGLTIGILPDADTSQAAVDIQIPICTGMGSARNTVNVLSSQVIVACAGGPGTISEIALALKHGKMVITMGFETGSLFDAFRQGGRLIEVQTAVGAVEQIKRLFSTV